MKSIIKNYSKNTELYKKSCTIFPGGVNSPVRSFHGIGIDPLIIKKGKGAYIYDVAGNQYIDFCGSWGALINGHAHPYIIDSINNAVVNGSSFGLTSEMEIALGEKILSVAGHGIEKIRFVSSGTEATMTAVRLARAATSRDLIIKFDGCYHGHSDVFLVNAGSAVLQIKANIPNGVPESYSENTISVPFNDVDSIAALFDSIGNKIAAVIFEPVPANMGLIFPDKVFIDALLHYTKAYGSLLIADEVINGFRFGIDGASGVYHFNADIVTYGKIIGGGMPLAAFAASSKLMDLIAPSGNVFQAGTLSGNPVAAAAGLANIDLCCMPGFYNELENKTSFLLKDIEEYILYNELPVIVNRMGSVFCFFFSENKQITNFLNVKAVNTTIFNSFFRKLIDRGIYISPSPHEVSFVSAAHSYDDLSRVKEALLDVLSEIFVTV